MSRSLSCLPATRYTGDCDHATDGNLNINMLEIVQSGTVQLNGLSIGFNSTSGTEIEVFPER